MVQKSAALPAEYADAPVWFKEAHANLGLKEAPGKANNAKVLKFYEDAGHPEIKADSVPWCAAFVGSCLARNGYPVPPSDSLMARSYRSYGVKCEPKVGAIMVIPRGRPPSGHVGFVAKVNANGTVNLLGGNQGDAVSIAKNAYKVSDALAFRWPVGTTVKDLKAAGSTEIKEAELLQKVAVAAPALGTTAAATEKIINAVPAAPEPGVLDQIKTLGEPLGIVQTMTEGTVAMGNLLMANLWLLGVIGLSAGVWYIAHKRKKARLAKHAAGVPLSQEVVFNESV